MGLATAWFVLRYRPYRRNLLFISTLVTIIAVFAGAVPLGRVLTTEAVWFAIYWMVVFFLAAFVLLLAIYDLIRIRHEHRKNLKSLDQEIAEAEEEARRLAEEELARASEEDD